MIAADVLLSPAQLRVVAARWRNEGRTVETRFSGTSMLPAIAPGAAVTLECGRMPRSGDVAVFVLEDQVGVHRIVACTGRTLLPWGDANTLPDDPITPDQVIGTLAGIAPRRPSFARWLLVALWLAPGRVDAATLRQRVRRLHHRRAVVVAGPAAMFAHLRRKLARV